MLKTLLSGFAGLLALSTASTTAIAAQVKNVVLVHGAFVDESSWQPVATILEKDGFHVTLVKNPLTSLDADVEATQKALDAQSGPAILVGHSWGGVVITEAGDDPKVKALVYVSAFAPEKGESVAALGNAGTKTEGIAAIRPDQKGYLSIDPAAFPKVIAADVPLKIAETLANNQLPLNHTAFEAKVTKAAWHSKPSFYVVSAKDKLLDPKDQHFFASRIKAKVTEVDGSHASLVVHAADVARVIEKAAAAQ
ncbi:alpha/beta fold hydrolase [Rhizobium sp. Rhizsp82]|uniref:alpha/beta fold hydrolase n=1 Tax=Rhizobium sp. Rhizsp82 TaxID=3243057 RepID=UPI0039B436B8